MWNNEPMSIATYLKMWSLLSSKWANPMKNGFWYWLWPSSYWEPPYQEYQEYHWISGYPAIGVCSRGFPTFLCRSWVGYHCVWPDSDRFCRTLSYSSVCWISFPSRTRRRCGDWCALWCRVGASDNVGIVLLGESSSTSNQARWRFWCWGNRCHIAPCCGAWIGVFRPSGESSRELPGHFHFFLTYHTGRAATLSGASR